MKSFESKVTIQKPANVIYAFLADMNNHKELMPNDIENWTSTNDEASFGIKNMAKLSLKIDSRTENREIRIIPAAKPPFPIELTWSLLPQGSGTEVLFVLKAELNMMMKMVALGPLQKLTDHETQSLSSVFS